MAGASSPIYFSIQEKGVLVNTLFLYAEIPHIMIKG